MRYAIASALMLAAGHVLAADALPGRLFYTPAQRAQLDALRGQKNVAQPTPEAAAPAPVPEVITYGGIVRRSDGRTTVWINDRAVSDVEGLAAESVGGRVRPDDRLSVQLPQSSRRVDLKVGQSVEVGSGAIAEPYQRPPATGGPREAQGDAADVPAARRSRKEDEDDDRGGR